MKHSKKKILILLSLFCVSIFFISIVSAKYIHKTENTGTITAKEFYFKSDLLDGGRHTVTAFQANADTAAASVKLRLMNHEDELRYSETDIDYTISIKDSDGNEVTTSDPNSALTGTISGGACNNKDITINGLQPGKTYTITATTDNTYTKTLTGTITVSAADNSVYAAVRDKGEYMEVTVWTKEYAGNVTLNYCQGLIPDNTDTLMTDAKTAGVSQTTTDQDITDAQETGTSGQAGAFSKGITISDWQSNTSHVFRFFKSDTSKTYQVSVNDKEVTVSE